MEPEYEVVMNFDISAPDRGMLTIPVYPTRPAPPISTSSECPGSRKPVVKDPLVKIDAYLRDHEATEEDIVNAIGCSRDAITRAKKALRAQGLLQEERLPVNGSWGNRFKYWVEGPPLVLKGAFSTRFWGQKGQAIARRLKEGPATFDQLMDAGKCTDDKVSTVLKRFREAGQLQSDRQPHAFGRKRQLYRLTA